MEKFRQNLTTWLSSCPEEIQKILEREIVKIPCSTFFCSAETGEINLRSENALSTSYLHSQADPRLEAQKWFSSLDLGHVEAIFIYGIGLGYYYEAALEWLKQKKNHYLIFLEDDREVLHRFLETERCSEMLNDPQVQLIFLTDSIEQRVFQFTRLGNLFVFYPFIYSGLECYLQHKSNAYFENKATLSFMISMSKMLLSETKSYGIPFFRNFFFNALDLPNVYFGNHLFGKFQGIPAIICGAGPSLNKNIDILATLQDRALIFAGGTALNALNAKGVMPHFGVGIDPNPDQFTRLVMNHAYETPFLYRSRILHEALEMVHGDRIAITGSGGYKIAGWLENKLGVNEPELEEGFNVLNFSVLVAHAMGCQPIICVGVDLAYSEGNSYAAGVMNHPLHTLKGNFHTKLNDEELVSKYDIYGRPIFTLWKWIAESMWYTHFSDSHPQTVLINATEGGIGFPNVPNMTLEEVKNQYLNKQFDVSGWIHGELQNSQPPDAYQEKKIVESIRSLIDSLSRCGSLCQKLLSNLSQEIESSEQREKKENEIKEGEAKLFQEEAYEIILSKFNEDFLRYHELERKRLIADQKILSEEEFFYQKALLDCERYHFLKEAAFMNCGIVYSLLNSREAQEALLAKKESEEILSKKNSQTSSLLNPSHEDEYVFDGSCYKIHDAELDLKHEEHFSKENQPVKKSLFYPSGNLKFETFYSQSRLNGPSFFYSENGILLASTWFIKGKQQGKAFTYYPDGSLHSLKFFREGLNVGVHQYFYSNGLLKSILPYKEGVLHGEILLYNSYNRLIRHLGFFEGKRHGLEQMWNNQGGLRIECQYDNDRPIGISRMWHPNGQLAKEVVYDQDYQRLEEREWDVTGHLIEKREGDDYFDQVHQQTDKLTASLNDMVAKMSALAPMFSKKAEKKEEFLPLNEKPMETDFNAELEKLKKEMDHLQSLDAVIKEHLQGNENDPKEAIWKTPSSRKQLEDQFQDVQQTMNQEMENIQKGIKSVIASLLDKDKLN